MNALECVAIYLLLGIAVAVWMRGQILPVRGAEDAAITVIALVGVVVVWPLSAYLNLTGPAIARAETRSKAPSEGCQSGGASRIAQTQSDEGMQ